MNSITIDGKTAHFELGHTEEEWLNEFGNDSSPLWDVSIQDIIEGAIEPNDDIIYWYINGRLYETNKEI